MRDMCDMHDIRRYGTRYMKVWDFCDQRDMCDMHFDFRKIKLMSHMSRGSRGSHGSKITRMSCMSHMSRMSQGSRVGIFGQKYKNHVTGTRNTRMSHLAVLNPIMSHIYKIFRWN